MTVLEMRDELNEMILRGHEKKELVILTPEWDGGHLERYNEHEVSFVTVYGSAAPSGDTENAAYIQCST